MEAPRSLLLLLLFIICSDQVTAQGCPTLDSIYPPSGLRNDQVFTVTGTNLDQSTLTSSTGTITTTSSNSTKIYFTINASTKVTITLTPTDSTCDSLSDVIDVKSNKVFFGAPAVTLRGQPGTVMIFEGCFPSTCGDNSTSYTIEVGGVQAELLDATSFGELGSLGSEFYIRLGDISTPIPQATVTLTSEYGTQYPPSSFTIDYQLSGNVTMVTPSTGQKGTEVNITGTNLIGLSGNLEIYLDNVTLGGVLADIINSTQSSVLVKAASGTSGLTGIALNSSQLSLNSKQAIRGPSISVDSLWSYLDDGVITLLVPPAAQEGTTVRICGTSILGGGTAVDSVTFISVTSPTTSNGLDNLSHPSVPSECVSAVVPASGVAQEGDVELIADTKAIIRTTGDLVFKYANVTSVTPSTGQEYTTVTITGTHLLSGYNNSEVSTPDVTLASKQATVITYSDTEITVQAEPPVTPQAIGNPGDVTISVSKFNLNFKIKLDDGWTYLEPGNISNAEPSFGQVGTRVTLSGTNLFGYGTKIDYVSILGSESGAVDSDPQVNATLLNYTDTTATIDMPSPVNDTFTGLVNIVIVADNGAQVTGVGIFEYRTMGSITSVSPANGQKGTFVTINGLNLFGYGNNLTEVTLGDSIATILYEESTNTSVKVRATAQSVTMTTPVDISLLSDTNAKVTSTSKLFSYLVEGKVSSITPEIGQLGTVVNITGTNLLGGGANISKLLLDGVEPATITKYTNEYVTVELADITNREVGVHVGEVYIESDTGSQVSGGSFTHLQPGNITSVTPTMGRRGTLITLNGYNLTGYGNYIESVYVGDYEVIGTEFGTSSGDSVLTIQAPDGPDGHSGPITIHIDTGATVKSTQVFSFIGSGNITSVSPASGSEGVGVLVEGTGLIVDDLDISSVSIGGSEVSRIVTESTSQISLIAGPSPNGSLTNLTVKITLSDGSFTEGGVFSYQDFSVSVVSGTKGQYGTVVVLEVQFDTDDVLVVKFDEVVAEISERNSMNHTVTVQAPRAQYSGEYTVDITVQSIDNNIARLTEGFTYLSEGFVCSVSPSDGQMGTRVTLTGENMLGGGAEVTMVMIGDIEASVDSYSDKEINATLLSNQDDISSYPYMVDVKVVSDTGAVSSLDNGFNLVEPGVISSVAPTRGQYGTVVTITGTGLLQNGNEDIVSVTLAGVAGEIIGSPNDTHVTVSAASSDNVTTGTVSIVLSTGAEITSSISFEYLIPGIVTSISPVKGTKGTMITIYGKGMLGGGNEATSVELGGAKTDVIDSSDTVITVMVTDERNASNTSVDVVITSNTGSMLTYSEAWSYIEPGNVTSISPVTGQQGVLVTIQGTDLLADMDDNITTVSLAGIPVTSIIEKTSTKIIVEAGYSNISQTGPVVIYLDSGPVITSFTNWSYYVMSIDSVSPGNGTNGTYVTLTGTNIAGGPEEMANVSSVLIGGIECFDVKVLSHDSVQARVGYNDNVTTSLVDVRVEASSGAYIVLDKGWSYLPNGVIASLEPPSATPGDNVTITGSRLVPDMANTVEVTVGSTKSFTASIINSSAISFRVDVYSSEDGPDTALPLYIVSNDGSTVVSDGDLFTFNPTTIADSVTPYAGQEGTRVTITGAIPGDEVSEVYLAGIPADILQSTSTQVLVTAGAGPDEGGEGSVTIVLSNGTFMGVGATAWTYLPILTDTHVYPLSGRNGTMVTIDTSSIPTTFIIQSVTLGDVEGDIVSSEGDLKVVTRTTPTTIPSILTSITLNYQDDIKLGIPSSWSYQPSVTIYPNSTLQGYYNSEIRLYGTGFRGGVANVSVSSVTLTTYGLETELISQSDELLVLRITEYYDSHNASVEGGITIISEDGAVFDSTSINVSFTYVQVRVDSVLPVQGQNGTRVAIAGKGLLAGGDMVSSLTLAGIQVTSIENASDTSIVGVAAQYDNSTGPEDIQYTVDTGAVVTIGSSWTYLSLGEVSLVTPSSGIKGTLVSILGERLLGGGSQADEVYLNGVPVLDILSSDDSVVHVRAGGADEGAPGSVMIVADTGATLSSSINEALFEYTESGRIDYMSPLSGQVGTRVVIVGEGLYTGEGIRRVIVAGVEADVIDYNSTRIEVVLQRPPTTSSFYDIVAVESSNRALIESSDNFTYLREGDITSVNPSQGQVHTIVTIRGNRLLGGGSVLTSIVLAGIPADILTQSDTEVKVRVNQSVDSAFSDVSGDIVLTADSGAQVSLIDSWTYVQVGVVTSLVPGSGQYGTRVTVTGSRLTAGGESVMAVLVGETESLIVESSSDTEVVFRAGEPSTIDPFTGVITLISNDFGELLVTNVSFSYTGFGQINSIEPGNGTGGTVIVINGVNLLGGGVVGLNVTSVEIAGISINRVINESDTAIVVEVGFNPDGQEKVGNVTIETSSGSIVHLENGWTYLSECPIGQFGNNTNSCSLCDIECDHCYGPTDYECYSCKNFQLNVDSQVQCIPKCPSLSTTDKVCVEMCESNQFELVRSDFNRYCIDCHSQCDPNLGCQGNRSTQCTACRNVELNGECVESCPIDYYTANRSICMPCSDECDPLAGCWGPDSNQCHKCLNVTIFISDEKFDDCIPSCPSGYYTDPNDYCQPCHSQCHGGCHGPLPSDCVQCTNAILTDPITGTDQCVEECNHSPLYQFYYIDRITSYCGRCHSHCSLTTGCFGPTAMDCYQCLNFTGSNTEVGEFYPRSVDGECVPECGGRPHEYYVDIVSGNCTLCPVECINGTDECTVLSCIVTSTTTSSTPSMTTTVTPIDTDKSIDALSAGAGVIGIVVGAFVVMLVIMLLIITVLACRLRTKSATGEIYPNDTPSQEGVTLQTTAFNRIDSNLSTGSHTRPRSLPVEQPSYIEPVSHINPVFNPEGYMDTQASDQLQNTYEMEDDAVSQTASEAYTEMEMSYQQQKRSSCPDSQLMPPTSPDDPPPPPRPPKPGMKAAVPEPRPPVPLPPKPAAKAVTFVDDSMELLTQDEYEDPQIVLPGSVPPVIPSRLVPPLPTRSTSATPLALPTNMNEVEENTYEVEDVDSGNLYEATDSNVPNEREIRSDLPPLITTLGRLPPSTSSNSIGRQERPPPIPSRSRSVKNF